MKQLLEKSGLNYRSAPEALVYISLQTAAVACVVLAYWLPSPIGVAVAAAGCSAALGLALPRRDDWRGQLTQVGAAVVALIVAAVLLAEGQKANSSQLTPPSQSKVADGAAAQVSEPPPTMVRSDQPDLEASEPATPETPGSSYVAPVSNGTDEFTPATEIGGVKLPDMGDGNPFATVDMSAAEMKEFEQLFIRLTADQKALQAKYRNDELSYDDFAEQLQERTDATTAALEAVMGEERVTILTQELARYYQKLAMNLHELDDETVEAMRKSPVFAPIFQD